MFERRQPQGLFALIIGFSLIGGFLGGLISGHVFNQAEFVQAGDGESIVRKVVEKTVMLEESSVIEAVQDVSPAVVNVVVTKDLPLYRQQNFGYGDLFNDPFFNSPFYAPEFDRDESGQVRTERRTIGGGSGFIVTEDGLMLTNRHVVEDPEADYTVVMNDGREFPALVISRDPLNDIAVVRIVAEDRTELRDLPTVELGESEALQVGQRVVAIGNALAEYENTVTTGVISAKGRKITAGSINSAENLINLLQTDAAINPGNSGGPLVNLQGQVIGINTAVASGAEGIGFAIPIDDVKSIFESVKEYGRIVRPFLGVRYMMLNESKAKELQLDVKGGALLVGNESEGEFAVVPASPADEAGLQMKDVILEVDGNTVDLESPLQQLIAKKAPGDAVELKVWRSGKQFEVTVKLKEAQ